jgi:predicted nucleic acid-binding protein
VLLVDTNIIAPLYIRSTRTDAVSELRRRDGIWRTEPFALIEFNNILVTYQRARYLTAAVARQCLRQAEHFLEPHYVAVNHEAALELAMRFKVTGYDARFLALADQLGSRLVTEDVKLRAAAPALTQSLHEALISI